ncbi:hypothetical protein FOL47_009843 [Perkinsus chesapeaki]|uniref:Uncharacterized protein n=1 Tax=Perkinsus chesapeaki TaxID=330153 RepID=A0A7J6L687_PERCH|nr:hypothetical protein FOL47_009843 [Perkinsus chesapeaki]
MIHFTLFISTFTAVAAIKRSVGAQQHLLAATDSLLDAIEKTEDAIDDQMLAAMETSLSNDKPSPVDFAQHMSSLLGQPRASVDSEIPIEAKNSSPQHAVSGVSMSVDLTNVLLFLGMLLMGIVIGVTAVAYREKVIACLESLPFGRKSRKLYTSRRENFRKATNPPFLQQTPMTESPVESA